MNSLWSGFVGLTVVAGLLGGCASRSVLPDVKEVKVSRDEASKSCSEVGKITGKAKTAKGTAEEALEDLKKEAARRGINYVKVEEYSALGTAVSGIGYVCR